MHTRTTRPSGDAATHILQVACQLFSKHGYKAVGMRRLAQQVGVQPGSLYYHIESKQSLLYELIEHYETGYLQLIRALAKKPASNRDELAQHIWAAMTPFFDRHAELVRLAQNESSNLSLEQQEQIQAIRQKRDAELCRLLISKRIVLPRAANLNDAVQNLTGILDHLASLTTSTATAPRYLIESQLKELLIRILRDA
ncbi:TetR/AcrR family transcriptional regulator [Pseudomonas sp. No.117]